MYSIFFRWGVLIVAAWRFFSSIGVREPNSLLAWETWLGGSVSNLVSRGLFVESSCTVEICIRTCLSILTLPLSSTSQSTRHDPFLSGPFVSICALLRPSRLKYSRCGAGIHEGTRQLSP